MPLHIPFIDMPPALIMVIGALALPILKGRGRALWMTALPLVALVTLLSVPNGTHWTVPFLDYQLIFGRVDALSRVFGTIFCIAAFAGSIYAMHEDDALAHTSAMIYAGSAVGVTFAGDFFSLYVFWEFMAVASTFLILARRTEKSQKAAFRYIMIHILGGLCLMAGIVLQIQETGTLAFSAIKLASPASWFIFCGVAVNAAVYPMHAWLKDAYPEATVTGAVFLSSFTTKSAVYTMARIFAGADILIPLGLAMALIPLCYAVIENDIRRVLAYSLINQVGFMIVGIGIGSNLALNGVAAHAVCHIFYKSLLFMSAGAVIQQTGKQNLSELGGLFRAMPWTATFCIVGGLSMSTPLFCGFVSKSMIISAAAHEHLTLAWFALQFAAVGVFAYVGIRVPFLTFFHKDSGLRPKEAPWNMRIAMGFTALGCVYVGTNHEVLYNMLPFAADYEPYTFGHVVGQLQLQFFGTLAFLLLLAKGLLPRLEKVTFLDTDWFYAGAGRLFHWVADKSLNGINAACDLLLVKGLTGRINHFAQKAPQSLAIALMAPLSHLSSKGHSDQADLSERIKQAFQTGTVPSGVGAFVAVLFIFLLYAVRG
ncbi:Na(+)/H(+) antiporter subunit D [Desulfoluna sp.]|uniref:Na(+)/H(+) antiporter subunit D n=1 Tax=Desulfoluna sp. TaxID=2045199 RepID=UPI0026320EAE|nr:Na(+)/H(+) antiporter subunit D [Desulfoluna sp.]